MQRRAVTPYALPRPLRWLLHLARFVCLAVALQLSSAPHLVGAFVGAGGCIDLCAHADDDDEREHGCPPGCADCSCPHGRTPSLPPLIAPALPERLAWDLPPVWTPYRPGAPPSAPFSRLDRPPRA